MGTLSNRKVTARQREFLDFIKAYMDENYVPPTVREIMGHFGWTSHNAVNQHLKALEKKGLVYRSTHRQSRNIRLRT